MKKVLSFHLVLTLHLHKYRIDRVKRKKSNCIKPLICVGVRFVQEMWTSVFITRSRALWRAQRVAKKRVCGKIYPACEANDDT